MNTRLKKDFSFICIHFLSIILVIMMTSILTISGQLFLKNTQMRHHHTQTINHYHSYTLMDTLLDENTFYQFRQKKENLEMLRQFYNGLYNEKGLELLSCFNQPLFIDSFEKGNQFLYEPQNDLQETMTRVPDAVKSFQINKKVFDFYHLQMEVGGHLDWKQANISNNSSYPLLLGNHLTEHYQLGDKITAEFYSKIITFEVVGFLEPNSHLYFKGNPEFYLDDYFIIPYPLELPKIETDNYTFEGILYFSMINSQLVTQSSTDEVLNLLKEQANKSGFTDYSLLEVDDFIVKHQQLLATFSHFQTTLILLISLLSILFIYLISKNLFHTLKMKEEFLRISWLIGYSSKKRIIASICTILYTTSILTCNALEILLFKKIIITPYMLIVNTILFSTIYFLFNKKEIS